MQETSQGRSDIQLNVCSLFLLEPVTNEELKEEAARDHLDFNVPSTVLGHLRTNNHFLKPHILEPYQGEQHCFKSQTFRTISG